MSVNSLPKSVTRRRRDCDLNPGSSAPESAQRANRALGYRAAETSRAQLDTTGTDACTSSGAARGSWDASVASTDDATTHLDSASGLTSANSTTQRPRSTVDVRPHTRCHFVFTAR